MTTILVPLWLQFGTNDLLAWSWRKLFQILILLGHTQHSYIYPRRQKVKASNLVSLSHKHSRESEAETPPVFLIFNFEQVYSQTSLFLSYSQTLCLTKLEAIGFCSLQCFSCDPALLYKGISIDFTRVSFHSYLRSINTLTN